jgi:hypothetical protein
MRPRNSSNVQTPWCADAHGGTRGVKECHQSRSRGVTRCRKSNSTLLQCSPKREDAQKRNGNWRNARRPQCRQSRGTRRSTQALGHTDAQTLRHSDTQKLSHSDAQTLRHSDARRLGHRKRHTAPGLLRTRRCSEAQTELAERRVSRSAASHAARCMWHATLRHLDTQTLRHSDQALRHSDIQNLITSATQMQKNPQNLRHSDNQTLGHSDARTPQVKRHAAPRLLQMRRFSEVHTEWNWRNAGRQHSGTRTSDTQTLRHAVTQTLRHSVTQTLRHSDAQALRCSDARTHRHSDTQTLRHSVTQKLGHSDTQTLRYSDA